MQMSRLNQRLRSHAYHLHGSQHNLGVEVVRDGLDVLALDGELLVEQRQVKLQLLVTCTAATPRRCLQSSTRAGSLSSVAKRYAAAYCACAYS